MGDQADIEKGRNIGVDTMSNASDFIIKNGVLIKYVGPGGDVVVPEGVEEIGEEAFAVVEQIGTYSFYTANRSLRTVYELAHGYFDGPKLRSRIGPMIDRKNSRSDYDYYTNTHKVLAWMDKKAN